MRHSYAETVAAHITAIAAGYEDCDDLDSLRSDPAFKIACGRAPESRHDLMSQPTLSRLANLPDPHALKAIGLGLIDLFCGSWDRIPNRIVLDIDDQKVDARPCLGRTIYGAEIDDGGSP